MHYEKATMPDRLTSAGNRADSVAKSPSPGYSPRWRHSGSPRRTPVLTAWALDPDVGESSPHLVTAFPLL